MFTRIKTTFTSSPQIILHGYFIVAFCRGKTRTVYKLQISIFSSFEKHVQRIIYTSLYPL